MAEHSRYHISKKQAGIQAGVLENKLGIKDQNRLDNVETILLNDSYEHFFELTDGGKLVFGLDLIFDIHKYFLGKLYSWAGKIRRVDISKDGVLFAPAVFIEKELTRFKKVLKQNLPELEDPKKKAAEKLAIINCEFNAIHPFREGNGRTVRLFLDLLAYNSGYELIDWRSVERKEYIGSCLAGMSKDYTSMTAIINKRLRKK